MSKKRMVEEKKNQSMVNADSTYDSIMEIIKTVLMVEGEVSLNGIGKLKIKDVPARNGRNPKTGETITVPAHKAVKFSVSKQLKDDVK